MSAIVVVGDGLLADRVCKELSAQYMVVRCSDLEAGVVDAAELVLVLHDTWHPSVHKKTEEILGSTSIPWLRGFVSFGEGIIGPFVRAGKPGCSQCAHKRYLMAGRDRNEMRQIEEQLVLCEELPRDAWASCTGLLQMAHLLIAEVHSILQGEQAHSEDQVYLINLKTLKTSRHSFLPDPLCQVCSRLPDDSPEMAQISLKPRPKISIDSYRTRSIDDLNKVLAKDYLDNRIGLLNDKMYDLVLPFSDVVVNLPLSAGDEKTAGRTHSYAVSEAIAILEGLERSCGLSPRGKKTVVHDSYDNLKEQALNPIKVGVHEKEQYAQPNFPFKPFQPNQAINWVWGYSFMQERPILVPELLAYYSLGCGQGFVYETSNGCALGGSLEEAILYGMFEVIERDSFLMTWYAQLKLPRLDPYSVNDQELQLMIDRVRAVSGYDLYFFNSTMEHGIPSVLSIAKNRKKEGMNIICAAGAHLDPVRATKSSIHELAGMMQVLDHQLEENREKYVRMLHDSSLVQEMDHHGMLYGLPEAQDRLQFLLDDSRPLRKFSEEYKKRKMHADLTDDLEDMLQVFRKLKLDVIVVDQTTPEIKRNGLHCVKVLIPGMLPMTFGHHLTRVTGLERVLQVPMELAYKKKRLTLDQLNPHPHPFP